MKIKAKKIIPPEPPREIEYTSEVRCDLCGKTDGKEESFGGGTNWLPSEYEFNVTLVRHSIGDRLPGEYAEADIEEFHICPQCWERKLKPWLVSQKANATKEERSRYWK